MAELHPADLGRLLRHHRDRARLDQRELAARAGVSVRALRDIELGRVRRPRNASLHRLLAALPIDEAERVAVLHALAAGPPPAPSAPGPDIEIGVLGPLLVRRGGATVELDQPMPRTLLALLALQAGDPVSTAAAIDVLWPGDPPRTCRNLIQVYVGRLRRLLEPSRSQRSPGRAIRRTADGYLLDPEAVHVDAVRFAELAADPATGAEALSCWRGELFGDAEPRLRHHPAAVNLSRLRANVALAEADRALAAGRPAEALAQLRAPVAAEPLHEGLHARLIRALADGGEQAEALRVFEDLRRRLDDQLGVTPGPEVAAAHLHVLRRPARRPRLARPGAGTPAPAQLPPGAAAFVGRAAQLSRMDRLAAVLTTDPHGPGPLVVVTGAGGVGKTSLAVHWARRLRPRFPDGQLYVNLRGYASGAPMPAVAALARFLHALGVAPDQVPIEVEEAAALLRTLVADRSMLVLLDNARDAAHVRPLLPAAPGCAVVVTSRDALAGLVAIEGAHRVALDVLAPAESRVLLGRLLGEERAAPAEAAVAELAGLCGHLPLALRIAAANLADPGTPGLAGYVAELRDGNRLGALAVPGDPDAAVRSTFDLSYTGRSAAERLVLRRLGLLPGPDVTAAAAGALAGLPMPEAAVALARLATAHLVEEHAPGRFALHDLVRAYAADRTARDDAPADRRAALERLHAYYATTADAGARLLYPQILRLPRNLDTPLAPPGSLFPAAPDDDGGPHERASAWFTDERANLVAAVTGAAQDGPFDVAWTLADLMRGHFFMCMPTVDWLAVARAGLAAALADGQPAAEAAARLSLAGLYGFTGHHRRAIRLYGEALTAGERADWPAVQATVLGNLGAVHADQGRLAEALEHLGRALEINTRTGWDAGLEVNLGNLGAICTELGRLDEAAGHLERAIVLSRRLGHRGAQGNSLAALGEVCHARGDLDRAEELLTAALALHREVGNRGNEADTTRSLAAVCRDRGPGAAARALDLAQQALELAEHTGHRRLEADARNTLGTVQCGHGRIAAAIEQHRAVLEIAEEAGYRYSRVQALIGLAVAYRCAGRPVLSMEPAEQAVALARQASFRLHEGRALTELAAATLALGDRAAAADLAGRALAVHDETGHRPGAELTRALLGGVSP
ncbi:tetratricopeptide repeat protein [Dactylosporangium sp. CA-233914]|uniref:tetratricopeptide repeat protein n=1 Tax=Dactylosporangium sp. CA-233914 TaxID=3239934 RepID=UPI003D8CC52B